MSGWGEWEDIITDMDPAYVRMLPEGARVVRNERYQVLVIPQEGGVTWLSIKRLRKEHVHDWRELWRIKNELTHPNREAFELYPSQLRVVDTSNQYHLFVLPAGAYLSVGYLQPEVSDDFPDRFEPNRPRQRPLPGWMPRAGAHGPMTLVARPVNDEGHLELVRFLEPEGDES